MRGGACAGASDGRAAALQQLYVQRDTKPVVLGIVGDSERAQAVIANSLLGQSVWPSFKAPGRPAVCTCLNVAQVAHLLRSAASSSTTIALRVRIQLGSHTGHRSRPADLIILNLTSFYNASAFLESLGALGPEPTPLDLHTWLEARECEYWRPLLFMFHVCHLILVRTPGTREGERSADRRLLAVSAESSQLRRGAPAHSARAAGGQGTPPCAFGGTYGMPLTRGRRPWRPR